MTDKDPDFKSICGENNHHYFPLLRVSAKTCTDCDNQRHQTCKHYTQLFNIFSHVNFDWRNKNAKIYANPSGKLTCIADYKKGQNTTNCWNSFGFCKPFTFLRNSAVDKNNNHKVSHYLLTCLKRLFLVPRVYASESEGASIKGKNTASSAEEEDISDSASTAVEKSQGVLGDRPRVSDEEVLRYLSQETGRDRLKVMFTKDITGAASPEVSFVQQVVVQSAAIVFLFMSVIGGRHARDTFLTQNQPTVFKTKFLAFRKLHDVVFLESIKAGVKWGVKITMFTFPFLIVSQSIAVYRNKTSPIEYSVAAGVTGSILKIGLGPKGMFAGGVIGAAMGAVGGVFLWAALKLAHQTQEERHHAQVQEQLQNKMIYTGYNAVLSDDKLIANPST